MSNQIQNLKFNLKIKFKHGKINLIKIESQNLKVKAEN
jgi:hypothetical protein